VDSEATVALITKSFDGKQADPKMGRAEPLRRAMKALITGGVRTAHASQAMWGLTMIEASPRLAFRAAG